MNNNVRLIDDRVTKLRKILERGAALKSIGMPVGELLEYLECLERLAVLERHLWNLTSDAYVEHGGV